MSGLYDRVQGAAQFLSGRGERPRAWIILGTGLGGLAGRIEGAVPVPYEEIPHFPRSTSPGHSGELILGRLQDVPVAAMAGRCHYYEGYSMEEVTLPVRVARALGAAALLVTSAVGGLDPEYRTGDLFAVEDHLNLMGDTPLRGPNDDRLGIRFPDMKVPYDPVLLDRAQAVAGEHGFPLRRGVLAAVAGPQLETRAEYRFLRTIGADAVGMSTVPEAIAGVHAGLRVAAFCAITDLCDPDDLEPVVVEDILEVAARAAPRLEALLVGLLPHV